KKANKSSFLTIVDAQLTTVIAAAVLFFFGESSVKGFATMLLLGILMIFVTAVFLSRWLLSLLVSSNFFKKSSWLFGVNKHHIARSEEHTSELQSRFDLVCRLLLEKKNRHSVRAGPPDALSDPRTLAEIAAPSHVAGALAVSLRKTDHPRHLRVRHPASRAASQSQH